MCLSLITNNFLKNFSRHCKKRRDQFGDSVQSSTLRAVVSRQAAVTALLHLLDGDSQFA